MSDSPSAHAVCPHCGACAERMVYPDDPPSCIKSSKPGPFRVSRTIGQYTACAHDADVILYAIEGGGRAWPGGRHRPEWIAGRTTDDIDASRVMWDFFVQHPHRMN